MVITIILLIFLLVVYLYVTFLEKEDNNYSGDDIFAVFYDSLGSATASYFELDNNFAGGTGSIDNPYLIENPRQLNNMRNYLDAHFKLISDIDMEIFCQKEEWVPIGNTKDNPFIGSFDGDNFKIINLIIVDKYYVGFFGYSGNIKNKSVIKNVILENLTAISYSDCGGLVNNNYGLINNCEVRGFVKGEDMTGGIVASTRGNILDSKFYGTVNGGRKTGGLIGRTDQGVNVKRCHVEGEIKGGNYVGGLIGENSGAIENAIVERCYTKVNILEGLGGVGGLVGINHGIISECFTECKIEAGINVGGLVGGNEKIIKNSYSKGKISGINNVGGLVGWNSGDYLHLNEYSIINCYTSVNVSADEKSGNLVGRTDRNIKSSYFLKDLNYNKDCSYTGYPANVYDMMQKETFVGWDFENIWMIDNGREYPYLKWFYDYYYN